MSSLRPQPRSLQALALCLLLAFFPILIQGEETVFDAGQALSRTDRPNLARASLSLLGV